MKEIELLREEMINNMNRILQYDSILSAGIAALLAFALDKDNFIFCLIPYVVIVPLYVLAEIAKKRQCVLSAYLCVFCEGQEYHWEGRNHEYDKKSKMLLSDNGRHPIKWTLQRMSHHLHYYSMNFTCSALAIYKIIYSSVSYNTKLLQSIFVIVLTVVLTAIMVNNVTDYIKERTQAINKWQAVKAAEEEAQKRDSNGNPQ